MFRLNYFTVCFCLPFLFCNLLIAQQKNDFQNNNAPCRIVITNHPVFKGRTTDPVVEIRYRRADFLDSIYGAIDTSGLKNIQTVFIYNRVNTCDSLMLIDSISNTKNFTGQFAFKMPTIFSFEDSIGLVITVRLKQTVSMMDEIKARIFRVKFAEIPVPFELDINKSPWACLRVGTVVRDLGQDGINTYRIPGMAITNTGRLIAVYDVRYLSIWDLPGKIDVGMCYSDDAGATWSSMKIILHLDDENGKHNGIGDPCILVDKQTNKIWVSGIWSKGDRSFLSSGPGLSPDETAQWLMVSSNDNGNTWSSIENITPQIKRPEWRVLFQGPGSGISLKDGTLVFPAQFKEANGTPFSTIVYSSNKGKQWQIGSGALPNTTESAVAELSNGNLLLNMRDNRGDFRSLSTTNNLGKTWVEQPASRNALIDPICMGSMISFNNNNGQKVLAFSNPHTQKGRNNLAIQLSFDDGKTWPSSFLLPVDNQKFFGYSSLAYLGNNFLGIIYEGKRDLLFTTVQIPGNKK
jgi:sialidase-1